MHHRTPHITLRYTYVLNLFMLIEGTYSTVLLGGMISRYSRKGLCFAQGVTRRGTRRFGSTPLNSLGVQMGIAQ